jgi:two-component system response regulator FixJ
MEDIAEQHIFFVDDEPTVRDVVRDTLEEPGIRVSCFAHPAECLEQLHCQRCDLLITDLKMPEMDGVELLRDARGLTPWLPVLVITGYGDIRTAVKAMKAGAVDFIEKPLVKDDFVQKVKSILQKSASADTYLGKPLTRTEKRVLELVVDGKSNKEIANLLHRSKRTIEVHRAHLMEKLGVDNLVDLVKRVAAMRLIDLQTGRERGEATRNSNKGP